MTLHACFIVLASVHQLQAGKFATEGAQHMHASLAGADHLASYMSHPQGQPCSWM